MSKIWTSALPVAQMAKNLPVMQETQLPSLGQEDSLEKAKATHSSVLAWRMPWTVHGVAKSQTQLSNFHSFIWVKNQPANAEDVRNMALIPGLGRSLGEGNGKPLQYSCLENPMGRGAWQSMGSQRVGQDWSDLTWHSLQTPDLYPYGEGSGTPLQYTCLENPMDGGAW